MPDPVLCEKCGSNTFYKEGVSKSGKPYKMHKCKNSNCDGVVWVSDKKPVPYVAPNKESNGGELGYNVILIQQAVLLASSNIGTKNIDEKLEDVWKTFVYLGYLTKGMVPKNIQVEGKTSVKKPEDVGY